AFGTDAQAPGFRPHRYERDLVAYTGTHDNDTVAGWWASEGGDSTRTAAEVAAEKALARRYLDTDGADMPWVLLRALMASVAGTVVAPVQDVLGLGSEARMNRPGTPAGNWRWRLREGSLTPALASRLAELAALYDRG
ncbi:MAG: 4-alpha-glucanotransferase, partial [Anaeromyxobacteraceae bacterium]|nr:4-alpha-glucanotransferase [Anaeromyxobacteraceae bacterium]